MKFSWEKRCENRKRETRGAPLFSTLLAGLRKTGRDRGPRSLVGGHCLRCASFARQDVDLSSLRAKTPCVPQVMTPRRTAARPTVEGLRLSAEGDHPNKFKKA